MALRPEPPPVDDPIAKVELREGAPERLKDLIKHLRMMLADSWIKFFTAQGDLITASPSRIALTELEAQNTSLSATPLEIGSVASGLYRITYYARITTPAVTSSSLTVTFSWTDGGVSPSVSGAAMTGNLTTTVQSGTQTVQIDDGTPITFATTYASNGAGQMQYSLRIAVERLAA